MFCNQWCFINVMRRLFEFSFLIFKENFSTDSNHNFIYFWKYSGKWQKKWFQKNKQGILGRKTAGYCSLNQTVVVSRELWLFFKRGNWKCFLNQWFIFKDWILDRIFISHGYAIYPQLTCVFTLIMIVVIWRVFYFYFSGLFPRMTSITS